MTRCGSCNMDIESEPPAHCASERHLAAAARAAAGHGIADATASPSATEPWPEIEAMRQIIIALRPLSRPSQLRVMRAVAAFFDIDLTKRTP